MNKDLMHTIFSEETINKRVKELAEKITRDYAGETLMIVGVLKGSFIFLSDLARGIDLDCEIRFLSASSYGYRSTTSGEVSIKEPLDFDIAETTGRHVLLVDDIIDTGITMLELQEFFKGFSPASFKTCVLLDKAERRTVPVDVEYIGFWCPNEFVVGYGLDYAERYRNLPYIGTLKPEVIAD